MHHGKFQRGRYPTAASKEEKDHNPGPIHAPPGPATTTTATTTATPAAATMSLSLEKQHENVRCSKREKRRHHNDNHDNCHDASRRQRPSKRRRKKKATTNRDSVSRSRSRSSSSTHQRRRHHHQRHNKNKDAAIHREKDDGKHHAVRHHHRDRRDRRRPRRYRHSTEDHTGSRNKRHSHIHSRSNSSSTSSSSSSTSTSSSNNNKPTSSNWKVDSTVSASLPRDDSYGHFLGGPGTIIADRYRVECNLGLGTFGRVVECLDLAAAAAAATSNTPTSSSRYHPNQHQHQHRDDPARRTVAIKMVRNVKRYYDSAVIEAGIVADVNRRGGRGISHFAVMFDKFNWMGHYCLVFESLGPSLFDYLKRNNYHPFPIHYVRDFAVQILEAIDFLHSFQLIHTDLKPENILLTSCREFTRGGQILPESTRIKIIDFGGATYDDEKKSTVVNTRQYRAPEVILGCGWSMPSDLWSAGCILAELYQGELLFATHDNVEHLAMMERILGPFPSRMLQQASHVAPHLVNQAFDVRGQHRMEQVLSTESVSYVRNLRQLPSLVHPHHEWFLDLLCRILVLDPHGRATAAQALRSFA